jgi:hypothetical protein
MTVVEDSYIKGAFKGWTGRGVYELVNGHKWKQVEYKYKYQYHYRPRAWILEDGGSYHLKVEGMDETIKVRRQH